MKWKLQPQFLSTVAMGFAVLSSGVVAVFAHSFSGGDFHLSWHSIDGGGGRSSGDDFEVSGTIGQPDAGEMTAGTLGDEYMLLGGFWFGGDTTPAPLCPPDIAPIGGDGIVTLDDLLVVINGWGECGAPCPPHCSADINHDCHVNITDLLAVINGWGLCP